MLDEKDPYPLGDVIVFMALGLAIVFMALGLAIGFFLGMEPHDCEACMTCRNQPVACDLEGNDE